MKMIIHGRPNIKLAVWNTCGPVLHIGTRRRCDAILPKFLNSAHIRPPSARLPNLGRKVVCALAAADDEVEPASVTSLNNWRVFWSTVDAGAWLGALGTAAAFIVTQEALLIGGPVILPLLALFASRQRENVDTQVARVQLDRRIQQALQRAFTLSQTNANELTSTLTAELTTLAGDLKKSSNADKTLRALETKISTLEGSMLSASTTTREALKGVETNQVRLARDVAARTESLRQDVSSQIAIASQEELSILGRLENRLLAVEASLSKLETSQGDGFRRLSSNLSTALDDAELALQAAVRSETWKSLEPVRQLPQILATMVPPMPVMDIGRQLPEISEDSVRSIIIEEIASAMDEITKQQRQLIDEIKTMPQPIDPSQWNQLGRKLMTLEDQLTALTVSANQGVQQSQPDTDVELKTMVQGMRSDIGSLAQVVQLALAAKESATVLGQEPNPQVQFAQVQTALLTVQSSLVAIKQSLKDVITNTNGSIDWQEQIERLEGAVDEALAPAFSALEGLTTGYTETAGDVSKREETLEQVLSTLATLNSRLDFLGTSQDAVGEGSSGVPISAWLAAEEPSQSTAVEEVPITATEESATNEQEMVLPMVEHRPFENSFASMNEEDSDSLLVEIGSVVEPTESVEVEASVEADNSSSLTEEMQQTEQISAPEPDMGPLALPLPAGFESLSPGELYERGLDRLKEARLMASAADVGGAGADLGIADAASWEAMACFEQLLTLEPDNIKALGNCGNALMTRGRLRKHMLQTVRAAAEAVSGVAEPQVAAAMAASADRLRAESEELLLLAGRKYKRVLELDPDQARAFVNWGRVVCLRAELADETGDREAASALFSNAADKFDAALDIDATNTTVMRLAGAALLESGIRLVDSDVKEGRRLMKDAEGYLAAAAAVDDPEAVAKLEECRNWLEVIRPPRR